MKESKTKISEKPFKLTGFTIEDYLKWCEKHHYKSYKSSSKKEFFKRVNNYIIIKRNNELLEEGEVL